MHDHLRRAVVYLGVMLVPAISACTESQEQPVDAPTAQRAETASTAQSSSAHAVPAGLARVEFAVQGMTCGGCAVGTRAALKKLEGVQDADANYEQSTAWAVYDPKTVTPERMMDAIRELGYTPAVKG